MTGLVQQMDVVEQALVRVLADQVENLSAVDGAHSDVRARCAMIVAAVEQMNE
jgi:hypothetical protein